MADSGVAKSAAMEAEKQENQHIAFYKLFSFADRLDFLLMTGGTLGAIIHGSAMPVFFLLFGNLINGFGKNQHDLRVMMDEVSKVDYDCRGSVSKSTIKLAGSIAFQWFNIR